MIAIVTDSTAYFTKKDAQDLGVHIVPINYSIGTQTFNEDYSDCNADITPLLRQSPLSVTTSHTPVEVFKKVFKSLVDKNYEVLCIVISSRLSGAYSSANIAAQEVDKGRIAVIDSLTTAGGLQLLTSEAAKLAKGDISLFELAKKVEELRSCIGLVFSVDDIGPLRRSGRLGAVQQSITTVLNIRPILACKNGTVVALGLSRGRHDQINKLVDLVPKDAKRIILHYIEKTDVVNMLYDKVTQIFSGVKTTPNRIGPVLEVHIGSGIIGLSWIEQDLT